ncbi:family 16 glycoside hydrolase [Acidobacteriota bacterium]
MFIRKKFKLLVKTFFIVIVSIAGVFIGGENPAWKIHDRNQPLPKVVDPGKPGKPSSDAMVLFDGSDLSQWRKLDGKPASWIVKDGFMQPVRGSGDIRTYRCFGDCQLHIEFATPLPVSGRGQGRGNSGVFLMGIYEVQVLDSFNNPTYADGQASALYGQYAPQVNACLEPGKWQAFDIIFHGPRFGPGKKLKKPANITVLYNGVLTLDHVELTGPTSWLQRLPYRFHPEKLPISIQDHGNPIRYRNIYVRKLPAPGINAAIPREEVMPAVGLLEKYTGRYKVGKSGVIEISRQGNFLQAKVYNNPIEAIVAHSEHTFSSTLLDAELTFKVNDNGAVEGLDLLLCGSRMNAKKE